MRVDQPRQQRLLAKIDNFTGVAPFDLIKFRDIDNFISGNSHRAILDGRSIHRHDGAGANDHSPFTTFRHSAINRLHASWQSNGTVAGGVAPGRLSAWSCAESNFSFGNFVDAIAPAASRFHKMVRRQPPLDRQKPATRSSKMNS